MARKKGRSLGRGLTPSESDELRQLRGNLTPKEMRRAAYLYEKWNAPMSAAMKGAKAASKVPPHSFDRFAEAAISPLEKATGKPSWKLARQVSAEYGGKSARRGEVRGSTSLRLQREATREEGSSSYRLAKAAKAAVKKTKAKAAKAPTKAKKK